MSASYSDFLAGKQVSAASFGIKSADLTLSEKLFLFQRDVTLWALTKGRAALFEDCGLGKTLQELEWAAQICAATGGNVIILVPLAVAGQMAREAARFGYQVTLCRSQADVRPGINITNYERLHLFDTTTFVGVVLDESSILKNFTGAMKQELERAFANTPFRLCATATPSPNDYLELGNHAQFLGIMQSNEMISRWFINDAGEAGNYRLKKHAERDFWRWVCSWAISLSHPRDLGALYDMPGYDIPPLKLVTHVVDAPPEAMPPGRLLSAGSLSATELHKVMRLTTGVRSERTAQAVASMGDEPCVVWVNADYEADAVMAAIEGAVEVRGSHSLELKEQRLEGFAAGDFRVLVTKPSICAFGLNWQHAARMVFGSLDYSFERYYQAVRRMRRFGQTREVEAHIVHTDAEGDLWQALQKKQAAHDEMKERMVEAMRDSGMTSTSGAIQRREALPDRHEKDDDFDIALGDCCELIQQVPDNSVGLTVTSPPFANLYIYSDHVADMGNCADYDEFFTHFQFLIRELLRVTKPGRIAAIHCKDLPMYKGRDGVAGLEDFPGAITRAFTNCYSAEERAADPNLPRWAFHSRVTIWKDPVVEMQRTKNHGLLYKNLRGDSTQSRQGMADYVLAFRKWTPGMDDLDPVPHTKDEFPLDQWQRWASPVWFDIDQMDVLNYLIAKGNADEKHICPLQLGVIERCIALWSNRGDWVYDPFTGIGSTPYQALKMRRRARGHELKPEYFEFACQNVRRALTERGQTSLLDFIGSDEAVSEPALALP